MEAPRWLGMVLPARAPTPRTPAEMTGLELRSADDWRRPRPRRPPPGFPPQPQDLRRRALALGRGRAASEAKATPRREVFDLIFMRGRQEGGRRRQRTEEGHRGAEAREPEARLAVGESGRPLPLPPRALRAPPPPRPPRARPPTRRGTRSASPPAPRPRPLPLPGTREHVPTPAPRLPVAAASPLSGAGTSTPPLPGGSEFATHFPTPSRGGGRASFSGVRRGGENQCHLTANCPRLRFPRQSGPPLAA